ncbi:MAG: hypothetical protein OEV00_04680 [Acidobacteriota bacterium]|nr:hypothetical protein [Acidobacteriota bacterium]MDH3784609.1 hypothetical protein [Acidobacteriota bacterium]
MTTCNDIPNEDWIGYLYDAIDPQRRQTLALHLDDCADCRNVVDDLQGTRQFMKEHAQEVPLAPRLVVLRPRSQASFWTFAAGLAAATAVFAIGLTVGMRSGTPVQQPVDHALVDRPTLTKPQTLPVGDYLTREEFEQALVQFNRATKEPTRTIQQPAYLTHSDLTNALQRLEVAFEQRSSDDFNFIMDEITAIESRGVQERAFNRKLMGVVMVDQDPRYKDQ